MSGRDSRDDKIHRNDAPRMDQGAFNLTPSQGATTLYADSMASKNQSVNDAATEITSYTYDSTRDSGNLLRELHNRNFNALNEAYFLPSDNEEWTRLNKQHVAVVIALGAPYPAADVVRSLLAPQTGVTKRILDLGCGTGVWANEMAREFEHAEVVGVDLAPVPMDPETILPNCRFEVDDINNGLHHFRNQFDLIHVCAVVGGIRDYRAMMADAHTCLKPGGMIIWMDGDYDIYLGDPPRYEPPATKENPSLSWFHRTMHEIRKVAAASGKSDFPGMMKAFDEGLWGDSLLDPETCQAASAFLPLGPWATNSDMQQAQRLKYVGSLMRQDLMSVHRGTHPVLIKMGWAKEVLDEWAQRADQEFMENKLQMSMKLRLMWGRRRASPDQLAPPLPQAEGGRKSEDGNNGPFAFFHLHATPEDLATEANFRNKEKAVYLSIPPSSTS